MKSTRCSVSRIPTIAAILLLAGSGSMAAPTTDPVTPPATTTNILNLTGATQTGVTPTGTTNSYTSTNSGFINGVNFVWDVTQPTGSGVFDPFLRLDISGNNGTEQGYNTSAITSKNSIFQLQPSEIHTHDVLLSSLKVTTDANGSKWVEFILDINETGNNGRDNGSLISLDGVRLYSTKVGSQSSESIDAAGNANGIVGNLLWDMDLSADGNSSVLLDVNRDKTAAGSGTSDMLMRVPVSVFNPAFAAGDDKLILWSRFGLLEVSTSDPKITGTFADAGYEEWAFRSTGGTPLTPPDTPPGVSEPASLALLGLGLAAALASRRRARQPAA